ncbi:hypothetical protein NL676_029149 [Syzygium grande]|nr:hypothetical protein NL676_029149 [Syzygium grande]
MQITSVFDITFQVFDRVTLEDKEAVKLHLILKVVQPPLEVFAPPKSIRLCEGLVWRTAGICNSRVLETWLLILHELLPLESCAVVVDQ